MSHLYEKHHKHEKSPFKNVNKIFCIIFLGNTKAPTK